MREWPVVITAYAIVWIAFGLYAYYLARRARRAVSTLLGSAGAQR
ncbi:MAG: CcmD family protein [Gemmatimonadaceae bacterium]